MGSRTLRSVQAIPGAGFAAAYVAGSAPASSVTGGGSGSFPHIRTYVTYAGSVTAATIRLWTRTTGPNTPWSWGASSDDISPLTPTLAPASPDDSKRRESRDWQVGAGVECLFVLESVSPGTSGNTVAVDVIGVSL